MPEKTCIFYTVFLYYFDLLFPSSFSLPSETSVYRRSRGSRTRRQRLRSRSSKAQATQTTCALRGVCENPFAWAFQPTQPARREAQSVNASTVSTSPILYRYAFPLRPSSALRLPSTLAMQADYLPLLHRYRTLPTQTPRTSGTAHIPGFCFYPYFPDCFRG